MELGIREGTVAGWREEKEGARKGKAEINWTKLAC